MDTGGATLELGGSFTPASLGNFTRDATFDGRVDGHADWQPDPHQHAWHVDPRQRHDRERRDQHGRRQHGPTDRHEREHHLVGRYAAHHPIVMSLPSLSGSQAELQVQNGLTLDTTLNLGTPGTAVTGELKFDGAGANPLNGTGTIVFGGSQLSNAVYISTNAETDDRRRRSRSWATMERSAPAIPSPTTGRSTPTSRAGAITVQFGPAGVNNGTVEGSRRREPYRHWRKRERQQLHEQRHHQHRRRWRARREQRLQQRLERACVDQRPAHSAKPRSTLDLGGAFTQAGLEGTPGSGHFVRNLANPGTVIFSGIITGGLNLDSTLGSWTFTNGKLNGGVFSASGSSTLARQQHRLPQRARSEHYCHERRVGLLVGIAADGELQRRRQRLRRSGHGCG